MQRRSAERVDGVNVGTLVQEDADQFDVPQLRGMVERRGLGKVAGVDRGPAGEEQRDGRRSFGFFVQDPVWEYSVVAFYYPLLRLDAAWGGRIHVFDLRYL